VVAELPAPSPPPGSSRGGAPATTRPSPRGCRRSRATAARARGCCCCCCCGGGASPGAALDEQRGRGQGRGGRGLRVRGRGHMRRPWRSAAVSGSSRMSSQPGERGGTAAARRRQAGAAPPTPAVCVARSAPPAQVVSPPCRPPGRAAGAERTSPRRSAAARRTTPCRARSRRGAARQQRISGLVGGGRARGPARAARLAATRTATAALPRRSPFPERRGPRVERRPPPSQEGLPGAGRVAYVHGGRPLLLLLLRLLPWQRRTRKIGDEAERPSQWGLKGATPSPPCRLTVGNHSSQFIANGVRPTTWARDSAIQLSWGGR